VELGTVASRAYATSVVDLLTSSDIVVGDKLGALLQKDVEALRFELLERDQSNSDRWKQMIEANAAALEAVQTIPVPTPELPPVRVKPVVTAAVDDDDTAAITAEGDEAVELEPTPVKDPVIFPVARPVIPLMQ
jgi:hypothetical protein